MTHTPARFTAAAETRVGGSVAGLKDWATAILVPADWGLAQFQSVTLRIATYPVLDPDPLAGGGVVVGNDAALQLLADGMFGNPASFGTAVDQIRPVALLSSAGAGGAESGVTTNTKNLYTEANIAFTVSASDLTTVVGRWGMADPFPLELRALIAVEVRDAVGTERAVVIPCPRAPAPQSVAVVPPPPAVSCDESTLRAGATLVCNVTGAPAGFDFLWRAAVNPTIAEGVLSTGLDGTGTFAIPLPADVAGRTLTVELVDWTGPVDIGVIGEAVTAAGAAGGPVPSGVPAGTGGFAGEVGIAGLAGVLAIAVALVLTLMLAARARLRYVHRS